MNLIKYLTLYTYRFCLCKYLLKSQFFSLLFIYSYGNHIKKYLIWNRTFYVNVFWQHIFMSKIYLNLLVTRRSLKWVNKARLPQVRMDGVPSQFVFDRPYGIEKSGNRRYTGRLMIEMIVHCVICSKHWRICKSCECRWHEQYLW